jgi:AbrB family looped-hinge helix DNA binding protein
MNQHFAQAKVTTRIQITLPKKVQDKLGGLEEGDYLLFYEDDGRIYIKRGKLVPETIR